MLRIYCGCTMLLLAAFLIIGCAGGSSPIALPDSGGEDNTIFERANYWQTDLIGGQHIDMGYVEVWTDNGRLNVRYVVENDEECDWGLIETQLYVGEWPLDENDNPKDNFPAPGSFPYKHEDLGGVAVDSYNVPIPDIAGGTGTFYVAAHGTVCCPDDREIQDVEGYCSGVISEVDLIVGNFNYDGGTVTVSVDDDENLVVKYSMENGWELLETHFYVGYGPPSHHAPGQFPYSHEDLDGADSDEYVIPLEDIILDADWGGDVELCFAAHAAVQKYLGNGQWQTETGWGEGDPIHDKGPWAMYWCGDIIWGSNCGPVDPEEPDCETVWALGNFDFHDYGIGRWGWWFDVPFSGWPE